MYINICHRPLIKTNYKTFEKLIFHKNFVLWISAEMCTHNIVPFKSHLSPWKKTYIILQSWKIKIYFSYLFQISFPLLVRIFRCPSFEKKSTLIVILFQHYAIIFLLQELTLVSQNQRLIWLDLKDHRAPTPLTWAGTPSSWPGCSKPHPTWPWALPRLGHP